MCARQRFCIVLKLIILEITHHTPPLNGLARAERLRGRGALSQLFTEGESHFSYPIRYVWCENDTPGVDSVLFTVPKRFHKRANRRNLLRRRIKEAYRLQRSLLAEESTTEGSGRGLNIALIYSSKEQLEYDRIYKAVEKALIAIARECGRTTTSIESK